MVLPNLSKHNANPNQPSTARFSFERLPQHLAIIMDGNGRWAKKRNLSRIEGHRSGAESVRAVVRSCRKIGIPILTLYAFSKENWQRPSGEVRALWKLLSRYLRSELEEMLGNGIRLSVIGDIHELPKSVYQLLVDTMKKTEANREMLLNLALSYSGRSEIVRAAQKLAAECVAKRLDPKGIDESLFSRHLDTADLPDPDLLIRTSGEQRISNFLLWQMAYTELYVSPVYWPDFREPQLMEALAEYQKRERRFGKTGEQKEKEL
jgi:undecaprenyl diphosphate synthase